MEKWETLDPKILKSNKNFKLLILLIVLSAIGPFSMQIFIPALPSIRLYFSEEISTVQLSLSLSMISIAIDLLSADPCLTDMVENLS